MQKSQSTCWKIEGRGKGSILLTMCAFSSSRDPSTVNKAPCIGICQQNRIREGSKPKSSQRSKSQQKKIVQEGGGAHLIQNLHFSPHELLMSLHSKAIKSEEMGCEWDFGCVVHAAQGKRGCRSPDSDMHHHIPISWDADVSAQNKTSKSETRWREIIRCAKGMKSPIWSALPVPLPIPVTCIHDPHQKQTWKKSKRHGIRWCGRVGEILT